MAEKKRGLGKGLSELLSVPEKPEAADALAAVSSIHPNRFQPRRVFDETALTELADSIKIHGVLQPVLVRRTGDGYELVAGERRWRAAQLAGLAELPVIIGEFSDKQMIEIAVVENVQRENLNPIEEALAYKRLMDECGIVQEQIAGRVGKNRSTIANTCRLLTLQKEIQDMISTGEITPGHARAILSVPDGQIRLDLAWHIAEQQLSVRQAETLAKRLLNDGATVEKSRDSKETRTVFVRDWENRLEQQFGTKVRIMLKSAGKGKIEIDYLSDDDLERILDELAKPRQRAVSDVRKGFAV